MAKSYEELLGAVGRAKRFRRKRHDAAALFSGEPPLLYFDDESYELKNISGSGSGATARLKDPDEALTAVDRIGVLRLVQRGEEIFRSKARRARAEIQQGRVFAGFALEREQFDLDDLRRRNARAIARTPRAAAFTGVAEAYRAHCADVVAFVGAHCAKIDRLLAPIETTYAESERTAIFHEMMAAVEDDWRALLARGNEFALDVHGDKDRLAAMKTYTEAAVTPTLAGGASWRRCYVKPMGYPGDYKIMNYMYDVLPEGNSLKENFLHGLGLIAGRPINTRMLKLSQIVAAHFASAPAEMDRRIASIGSGPAREIEHIVRALGPRARLTATLIDQETEALEYAADHARRTAAGAPLDIRAYNTTFKEMFNPAGIDALGDQDIIYSLGLVDYFSPLLATRFVSRAFDLVRPGGKVVIGNASDSPNGTIWTMEHILDWTLFFRTRDDMAALAREAKGARVTVEADPLDSIYFLVLEKAA